MFRFGLDVYEAAEKRSAKMGVLRNSFTQGRGNLTGFCGELALEKLLQQHNVPCKIVDTYQFDMHAGPHTDTLEVKSKTARGKPRDTYSNSVSNHNAKQKADNYVFLRVVLDKVNKCGVMYFCGSEPCQTFRKRAHFVKKGDIDPSNNYVCRSDCWSMQMRDCKYNSFAAFMDFLNRKKEIPIHKTGKYHVIKSAAKPKKTVHVVKPVVQVSVATQTKLSCFAPSNAKRKRVPSTSNPTTIE
ncbi:hypothetical protein OAM67_00480 [bacterium]|nr:hypothetical protein [bacterium]